MPTGYPVTQQIKNYTDPRDGSPLNGTLRFGIANQDPEVTTIEVYWDVACTQVAPQPIRVRNGFALRGRTPANVYAVADFSAIARDTRGRLVCHVPNSADIQLAAAIASVGSASLTTVVDAGGYFTGANVEAVLQEVGASIATLTAAVFAALPTGALVDTCNTSADIGFVMASSQTIGNAASGALDPTHQRANADTAALFTLLWNSEPTNTILVIRDSSGNPTTRLASAALDFAANKRMPTPDLRGRVRAGMDNMGGTTAQNRLTNIGGAGIVSTTLFASGGTQTHTLVVGEAPDHTHSVAANSHTHTGSTMANHTHTGTTNAHEHNAGVKTGGVSSLLPDHSHTIPQVDHLHSVTVQDGEAVAVSAGSGVSVQSAVTKNVAQTVNTAFQTTSATPANTGAPGALTLSIANHTGIDFTTNATLSSNAVTVAAASSFNTSGKVEASGTAHQNTQPTMIFNVMIKL